MRSTRASRLLVDVASRAAGGRSDLGEVEAELAGKVTDLQLVREQARALAGPATPARVLGEGVCPSRSGEHKTSSIQRWLLRHPRFTLHFTPSYSSWLNLVERWFAELTTKWIKRGSHRSVRELVASIRTWIANWNDDPSRTREDQSFVGSDNTIPDLQSFVQAL